jgi:glutathione S-transferase
VIELYLNWNAVCAMKVVLCLAEKNLQPVIHHIDLSKFEQHAPDYLKLNPGGVVPTMVHEGTVILESTVMLEYLDDRFPTPPLRPADPVLRAKMRMWGKLVDDQVHPSIRPITFTQIVTERARAMSEEDRAAMLARTPKKEIAELWQRVANAPYSDEELGYYLHKIEDALDRMEASLQTSTWLLGEQYTLADIGMTPYLRRLDQLGKSALWQARPAVVKWFGRIQARPSYAAMDELKLRYAA